MRKTFVSISSSFLRFMFVAFIFVISITPILWVLISSFKTNTEILNSALALPQKFSFINYMSAFQIAPIAKFYKNSILVTLGGTFINLVALTMASYVIARFQFRFRVIWIALFSSALIVPPAALLQPLYFSIKTMGLYDSLWALILVYAGFGLPVSLYVISSYFRNVPKAIEESSYIDGAGFFRTFSLIALPLSTPALATSSILQFILCWNEFQFALILTTGNHHRTLPIALYYFKSQFASNYGSLFAATILVTLPTIIVYIISQKWVVAGLVSGAVKE